jgi:hypothetical protein
MTEGDCTVRDGWVEAAVELMGRAGRNGTVRVQGISMLPTLEPGRILVVDFTPARLRMGDVLLFRQGGILVVHRFLGHVTSRSAGPCLRTRGDGRPDLDPPLRDEDVLGRVIAVERGGRLRSLDGVTARAYALGLAMHDHFWAAAAYFAGRIDHRATKLGLPGLLRPLATWIDRTALRVKDRLLFAACHRGFVPPEGLDLPTGDEVG